MLQQSQHSRTSKVHGWIVASACTLTLLGTCGAAWAVRLTAPVTQGASAGAVHIAPDVMAAHATHKVPPVYPPAAREAGVEGPVVMAARIGKGGAVQKLTVVSGPEDLQAAAVDSVLQWHYEPFIVNGSPVEVETTVTVTFQLHD